MFKSAGAFLVLAMMVLATSFSVKADNCDGVVDEVAKAFGGIVNSINKSTSMQELMDLDYGAIATANMGDVSDECMHYVLTGADKVKLEKSFDGVLDALAGRMADFTNGQFSKEFMRQQLEPLSNEAKDASKKSKTIGEWFTNMTSM